MVSCRVLNILTHVYRLIWCIYFYLGHKLGRRPNMDHFCPYCVLLVYFLLKSKDLHVKRTECQRILFHFLNSYFIIIPAIAALRPPSSDFYFSGQTPLTLPIAPPALLVFALHLVNSLRRRVIYTGRVGVLLWWGFP